LGKFRNGIIIIIIIIIISKQNVNSPYIVFPCTVYVNVSFCCFILLITDYSAVLIYSFSHTLSYFLLRVVFTNLMHFYEMLYINIKEEISVSKFYRQPIAIVNETRCTNVSNLFYFGMTLHIFRAVFPSIIRSLNVAVCTV